MYLAQKQVASAHLTLEGLQVHYIQQSATQILFIENLIAGTCVRFMDCNKGEEGKEKKILQQSRSCSQNKHRTLVCPSQIKKLGLETDPNFQGS